MLSKHAERELGLTKQEGSAWVLVSNFDMNVFIPEVVVNLHPLAVPMWILSTINTNSRAPFLLSDADVDERIHLIENVSEVEF